MGFFPILPWWIESVVIFIGALIVISSVYKGRGKYATWVVVPLAFISFFMKGLVWSVVTEITFTSIAGLIVYLVLGITWSFVHFYFYARRKVEAANEQGTLPRIYPSAMIGKIVTWIFYWPIDAPVLFFMEPVVRFGTWCVKSLSGAYNSIAQHVIEKFYKNQV